MQFAPSPSLFFTKYFFLGQNTVFSLSEYCFWFLKVGISASAILVRQCNFQNLVLFRPHRTLEHKQILTSRPPVALTEHLL